MPSAARASSRAQLFVLNHTAKVYIFRQEHHFIRGLKLKEHGTVMPLLTPDQAAKVIGISVAHLNALRRAGLIPHLRFSRKTIRYERQDMVALAAKFGRASDG